MKRGVDISRLPQALTIGCCAVGAVLYLLCIAPASDALERARRERGDLEFRLSGVQRDLRESKNVRERLAALAADLAPYEAGMLKPLLGSWAMRAKSLIDPLADGVDPLPGFVVGDTLDGAVFGYPEVDRFVTVVAETLNSGQTGQARLKVQRPKGVPRSFPTPRSPTAPIRPATRRRRSGRFARPSAAAPR